MKWKIPLYKVDWNQEDIRLVTNVIKRGMDWAIGPEIEEFEKLLANYHESKYCVTFNSGTSAGHAALLSLNLKPSSEVIIPSFTFISTANWPLMVGANPIFSEIEEETLGMDSSNLNSIISKKSKVIMPIHYGGNPCKITEIKRFAKEQKLTLIEDCAESIGATIGKRKTGTYGDLSILSFAGNKVLTTGEGGAIITNSKQIYEKLKLIRSHGRQINSNYFQTNETPNYVSLGYNWRMSSMTAALGISQLKKIEKLISKRRKNANYLSSKLKKHSEIILPSDYKNHKNVFQLYSIRITGKNLRNNLMKFLKKQGIMSKIFFEPAHLTKFHSKNINKKISLPVTEKISQQILTLPMYPGLTKNEMNFICDSIDEFFELL
jgi:perosamine synthetase